MNKEQLQTRIDAVDWWHTIKLPWVEPGNKSGWLETPGKVNYLSEKEHNRFGLPYDTDFSGKSVLDVGCWDGFFTLTAHAYGAEQVIAIDPFQGCSGSTQEVSGFNTMRAAYLSAGYDLHRINFMRLNLTELHGMPFANTPSRWTFDVTMYFGVLYHVDDPITQLRQLFDMTKEYSLIETAVSTSRVIRMRHGWEFKPGFSGDPTNKWYPSPDALRAALLHVGFRRVEMIHETKDRSRVTVKAIK